MVTEHRLMARAFQYWVLGNAGFRAQCEIKGANHVQLFPLLLTRVNARRTQTGKQKEDSLFSSADVTGGLLSIGAITFCSIYILQ